MFLNFLSLSFVFVSKYNVKHMLILLFLFQVHQITTFSKSFNTNNFCIKRNKTIKVRVIFFHMETYINTCHMCKESLKQSLSASLLDGEVMP